jgi:hypothetical protein
MFILKSQKRVSWIHHIHHFPRVVTLLPLQCSSLYSAVVQPFHSHVASFTNIKLFVMAGIGHRDLKWIKQEEESHLYHPWGWCPWLQDRDNVVKPFEVGFTLQVSHLSQLVTLVWNRWVYVNVMHGRYSVTWPPVYLQSWSQLRT